MEPGQLRTSLVPRADPRPRDLQHGAHRDADGAPVERVGAARRDENGVRSDPRHRAEDGPNVGRICHVLENDHPPGVGQQVLDRPKRRPVQGGDESPMQQISRELLQEFGRPREHGDVIPDQRYRLRDSIAERQYRARTMAGAKRALEYECGLGKVESVTGALRFLQRDIGLVGVVSESRIVERVDLDNRHQTMTIFSMVLDSVTGFADGYRKG